MGFHSHGQNPCCETHPAEMNVFIVVVVGCVASMAFLVGPIAAGLLLVGVLIYLMTSDRTRLRKTLELEEKRLVAVEKTTVGTPLVCVAATDAPVGGRVSSFGDCILTSLGLQNEGAPKVRIKMNQDGVLLSTEAAGDAAGPALPMGSFWTRSYAGTLAGMGE